METKLTPQTTRVVTVPATYTVTFTQEEAQELIKDLRMMIKDGPLEALYEFLASAQAELDW